MVIIMSWNPWDLNNTAVWIGKHRKNSENSVYNAWYYSDRTGWRTDRND